MAAYNAQIQQLADAGASDVDVALFNKAGIENAVTGEAASSLPALTRQAFRPRGRSPIYDRVAELILAEAAAHPGEKVTVVIITDGCDNASQSWTKSQLDELIARKRADGWAFVFPLRPI